LILPSAAHSKGVESALSSRRGPRENRFRARRMARLSACAGLALEEVPKTGASRVRGHDRLNFERERECGAPLLRGDFGRTASAYGIEKSEEFQTERFGGHDFGLGKTEAGR